MRDPGLRFSAMLCLVQVLAACDSRAVVGDAQLLDASRADAPDGALVDGPATCDTAKIGFPQSNPQSFSLYEICITASASVEQAVRAIDPEISCAQSAGGAFAKCPAGQWHCLGDLEATAPSGSIATATWQALCALSLLDDVLKIVGGHLV